jgi:photosystem II Psb27 protein
MDSNGAAIFLIGDTITGDDLFDNPSPNAAVPSQGSLSRRGALVAAVATMLGPLPALADKVDDKFRLKRNYPEDAKAMLENMRVATELTRGAPDMENTVKSTRSEMNDFVAFYRRQPKVAGMPSFSTMYTAINTLSGHYASYGNKYPVPAKRKDRLLQQYKEIERALARGK